MIKSYNIYHQLDTKRKHCLDVEKESRCKLYPWIPCQISVQAVECKFTVNMWRIVIGLLFLTQTNFNDSMDKESHNHVSNMTPGVMVFCCEWLTLRIHLIGKCGSDFWPRPTCMLYVREVHVFISVYHISFQIIPSQYIARSHFHTIKAWTMANFLEWTCNYLAMLGLKLVHVSKMCPLMLHQKSLKLASDQTGVRSHLPWIGTQRYVPYNINPSNCLYFIRFHVKYETMLNGYSLCT